MDLRRCSLCVAACSSGAGSDSAGSTGVTSPGSGGSATAVGGGELDPQHGRPAVAPPEEMRLATPGAPRWATLEEPLRQHGWEVEWQHGGRRRQVTAPGATRRTLEVPHQALEVPHQALEALRSAMLENSGRQHGRGAEHRRAIERQHQCCDRWCSERWLSSGRRGRATGGSAQEVLVPHRPS